MFLEFTYMSWGLAAGFLDALVEDASEEEDLEEHFGSDDLGRLNSLLKAELLDFFV